MSNLYLIDGNSLMFRSYYATAYTGNLMKTKEGIYTNALFGFVNMITKLLDDNNITDCFVAFDAGKKTFRHQEYDEYKGGRKPMPEEFKGQIPLIKEYLDLLNIKRLEDFDYEADDLISIVCNKYKTDYDKVIIITGDHDLLQLVGGNVEVSLTKKGVGELDNYNEKNFYDKMGFLPNQIIEYKGIVGDSSDNLPGIKGIGDKTCIKLLNEFNTLDGIYENLDKLTPKAKSLFIEYKDIAYKCRYLATLVKNAEINVSKEDLKIKEPAYNELINFFTKYEFTSILKKLKSNCSNVKKEVKDFTFSFDYENITGDSIIIPEIFKSNYYTGKFLGLGIINNSKYYFVDLNNINLIKEYLENNDYKKYTFDFKALYFCLLRLNINVKNVVFDLLLASYLINPDFASGDFKEVSDNFLISDIDYYQNVYGSGVKEKIPEDCVYKNYSISKCMILNEIKDEVINKINELNLNYLFTVELNLSKVLAEMEINGLKIDLNRLNQIEEEFSKESKAIEKEIYNEANLEFNINSPKQLGEVLFEKLNLPHGKKNKTGYSTSVDVLEALSKDNKIVRDILEYRALSKLVSTYCVGLKDVCYDGFIHPIYKQAYTNTGRLSSIEPNIQNMPIRTERGQVIREIFTSRFDDGVIIASDYSQIELRVLASLSNDKNLVDAFNNGLDIHSDTASKIFDVDIKDVTKDQRRSAKTINFGIIYGMSAWGLSETLEISPIEANMFINKYFDTYKEAKNTLDGFIDFARKNGYSKTLFNRIRYINGINDKNFNVKSFSERTAMNSPIQGTAADIIKIAMVNVNNKLKENNLKAILIAQVHDELVLDCPNCEKDKVLKLVKEEMENACKLSVKLLCEANYGENWFLCK